MNKVLFLQGTFQSQKHPKAVVKPSLPQGTYVKAAHIRRIVAQLKEVHDKWMKDTVLGSCLVSVHCNRIIPKTKRISYILKERGSTTDKCICGVRFEDNDDISNNAKFHKRHVFTYNVSLETIKTTIQNIEQCADIVDQYYNGTITSEDVSDINDKECSFSEISRNLFNGIVVDCHVIHHIEIDENRYEIQDGSLISLYKTKIPTKEILRRIGIDITDSRMLDECTVRLYRDEINLLQSAAPYLISMLNDFSEYDILDHSGKEIETREIRIPYPSDEPIIGVIDTQFDERVYFHEWVDYKPQVDDEIGYEPEDFFHGTAVSSIIVDGPNIEPRLDDGCGRFRVRHFGVAKEKGTGSFEILKKIKGIVASNRDIKVWNLSLGSLIEVSENSISSEGAILDQLQSEYDVLFVVAGTNDRDKTGKKRIGAPADSINSIVVNAVDSYGKAATYARTGPVLGFFYKPDLSCYGGDTDDFMRVCSPLGEAKVSGTSFAAPWISRKAAFLIYKMGLNRELTKAILIDAAAGWDRRDSVKDMTIGYGIVPIGIRDILETNEDEVRFLITGNIKEYETYNYTIPVPVYDGMQPFWARATLVYFPYCDRNQGVDYTSTEVDLHFGRVYKQKDKVLLKEINDNKQAYEGFEGVYEEYARQIYRKWDNVKYISEKPKSNARPKKVYEAGMWGLRIVTKERGSEKLGKGMRFGAVVTLKEMRGKNRIDDFIKLCGLKGWLVNQVDIDANIDLYNKTDEDVKWD